MNTNPEAMRILCFGDSNTWGRGGRDETRYSSNVRWTGLLQKQLGLEFEVIEEGLRSRTTNLDDDPQIPGRNGLTYLRPCIESHNPIDVVVLFLGTNDLKSKFARDAEDVAQGLNQLIDVVKENTIPNKLAVTKIILISPPTVREEVLKTTSQFIGAEKKSRKLVHYLSDLGQKRCDGFIDLSKHVEPGIHDGVHLEVESHPIVAAVIAQEILKLSQ